MRLQAIIAADFFVQRTFNTLIDIAEETRFKIDWDRPCPVMRDRLMATNKAIQAWYDLLPAHLEPFCSKFEIEHTYIFK